MKVANDFILSDLILMTSCILISICVSFLTATMAITFLSRNERCTCRHVGCICTEGWEGDHCEKQNEKHILSLGPLTTEIIHEIEDYFSAAEIVGILIALCIVISLLFYFVRYCIYNKSNSSNKRGGTSIRKKIRRRRGRATVTTGGDGYSDSVSNNNTRDII